MERRTLLALDQLSLTGSGARLTLEIDTGDAYAVMGPWDSQKADLIPILAGEEDPGAGRCILAGDVVIAGPLGRTKKTPQAIASEASGKDSAKIVEVLTALGLWDNRQTPLSQLSSVVQFSAELIPVLAGEAEIMLVDGQLDVFDPWSLPPVLALIERQRALGRCLIAVTNSVAVAEKLGQVIIYSKGTPRFAGTTADLIAEDERTEILVETDDPSTVRSLVQPFEVGVKETPDGLILSAPHGQETAARLLKEGYGSVKMVILRQPTLEEALLRRA
jgi:ABC-type multidrug transport system ATPase subunit